MNLLVTGCAGFIGSNFVYYYLDKYKDRKIIGLDKLTYAGNLENLAKLTPEQKKRFVFVKGDITNRELIEHIFEEFEIDVVINFAAESHVDRSIIDPHVFVKTNVLGTQILLDVAKNFWYKSGKWIDGKRFIQISTDEVYGSLGKTGYFTEKTPLDPHSPYSASKAAADLIVKAYFDTYKMPVNITRCSNNYGPYQFPEKLIPLVINNCLNKRPIPVYGDGLNIRDWLYVEDHCKAIDLVIEKGVIGEIYNIGGHNERTNIEIVKMIINYLKKNFDESISEELIRFVEDRKGHDRRYAIDPSKIMRELGWVPETKFEDGIVKTINWYLNNRDWLNRVTTGKYMEYYDKVYGSR
ncbi:dTDP-glucose 4,6-dehydratase [Caldicellulosiruptor changbaiensis]|uniref:dTDP-glucose 4,6-dehydratase n=1 Tax=Caldicellulosiruptor changbaiensis TaxID=1222016 RepID=A0A3T0D987_9FIRM|nr:dTDP-glucose 4,6-dehydratase [Caldicellulosiruptor changbaiensis]AZT91725.1 dTDP-glucose 4,6-dehydratase [Caldicellulosiruptor changbaiensis]